MCSYILSRRDPKLCLEKSREIHWIRKTAKIRNIFNAAYSLFYQNAGMANPQGIEVFGNTDPVGLFKQRRYIFGIQPHVAA